MGKSLTTRTHKDIESYYSVLRVLRQWCPQYQQVIAQVTYMVQLLGSFRWIFSLEQYEKLIYAIRVEHDYSGKAILVGRELQGLWINPVISSAEKTCLSHLRDILEPCLRRAFEFFLEAERHLIAAGKKLYVNPEDNWEEYNRAQAALWPFQHEFHMYIFNLRADSDRYIIFREPPASESPTTPDSPNNSKPGSEQDKIRGPLSESRNAYRPLHAPLVKMVARKPGVLKAPTTVLLPTEPLLKRVQFEPHETKVHFEPSEPPRGSLSLSRRLSEASSSDLFVERKNPPSSPRLPTYASRRSRGSPYRHPTVLAGSELSQLPTDVAEIARETKVFKAPSSPVSSSLPSVGSFSPTLPRPTTKGQHKDDSDDRIGNGSRDKLGDSETVSPKVIEAAQISPYTIESENAFRDRAALETSKEIILSTQAYLGRRHDEYASQLAAEPPTEPTKKAYAWHEAQSLSRYHSSARGTRATALLHWAAVSKARREERINGYNTLHRRATEQGEPRRTSGFRTSLRASLFAPLGPPDLAGAGAGRKWRAQAQEATLANLAQLRPRLDLTLLAFSFNEDALRLYGGLVGGAPRARDLARMDRILRELEVYVAVCAHRRKLVVGHLKRARQFPVLVPAQFGDLQAACGDAEEDQLAVSRRCSEYVAGRSRSRYVMTYEGKRRRRDATGQLAEEDYEKLDYLKKIDDEAERLCSELDAAGEWLTWCRHMKEHWALGWRPDRVEKDMLYVGEDTQSDVRRYKREINEKRAALGLVPVARPQDEVYERQQEQIKLLDGIWNLMA
ncbi:hypothetical protein J7T55_014468 [Diaporthe amygdali]|uniref:uncharacterized protein n=1 Tax=Phomopsis amygdali TaxID=1214568 RepID=UPI0022FEB894|nr:uncharacterized protein J7T55_014468 [Diaporthe amygdali]KAJ0118015.1 hypothetical protein J7T55_014468 [Diaporthe amygdali]